MNTGRRTRVLLLGPAAPVRGGMASVVDALSASALGTEFELGVLNTGKTTPEGRPWYVGVGSQLRLLGALTALLARGHGELVHVHTCSGPVFWRDAALVLLARIFRRRTIWHVHGGAFDEFIAGMSAVRRALASRALLMSETMIVLSESWRARLARHLAVRRWAVVANGVALPPAVRRRPGADALLFVGTLDGVKGADDLLAGTALAARHGFGASVCVAGRETSPGQRERLERLVERAGLTGRVHFPGVISGTDKVRAFETAGIFALPSYVEGLPMALLEAMSYGLPVIATDVGAIPEVVTDGVEGFLIAPGDVDALAERITRLSTDVRLRDKMGAAARSRVEEHYTIEAMASGIAAVYRSIRTVP